MNDRGLESALKAASSATALARAIGVTSQAIAQWRRIPAERCQAVSAATGIPLHDLRPDIYPAPSPAAETPASEAA